MTIHATNKLTAASSLRTVNLRLSEKKRKLLGNIYGKAGAKLIVEFSPINAKLLHADAFITTLARAPLYKLQPECYVQCDQTWGALPVLVPVERVQHLLDVRSIQGHVRRVELDDPLLLLP